MIDGLKKEGREYGMLDIFRLAAAGMIVAIHTGPFSGISEKADTFLTYGAGRIAVPFFFMVTGYFVLSGMAGRERGGWSGSADGSEEMEAGTEGKRIWQMVRHLVILYLLITLLYLPVSWYSGNLPKSVGGIFKQLLFDGTFYHLWYLPAAIIGIGVSYLLLKYCGLKMAGVIAALLYLLGLFGDSYYGAVEQILPLKAFYELLFCGSTYTRNGIFFAPLFLILGAALAVCPTLLTKSGVCFGFLASLSAMLFEVGMTANLGWQRHNSMYLFLPLVMFFLFEGLSSIGLRAFPVCRSISMWVYLLHPLCILLLRGAAGVIGQKEFLAEHTLVFYLLVCLLSAAAAILVTIISKKVKAFPDRRRSQRNMHEGGNRDDGSEKKPGMD